jgi:hypothetical protein
MDEERLRAELATDHFQRLVGDDVAIAFAFAQLIVDGDVRAVDRQRALRAIERQGLPSVLEFRDWENPATRRRALSAMRRALEEAAEA